MIWQLDPNTQCAAQNFPLPIPAREPADQASGHASFNRALRIKCLRPGEQFLESRAAGIRPDSPTQIIAEFQRDGVYLPALALTVSWGGMERSPKTVYGNRSLDQIHNTLEECRKLIVQTDAIEEAWKLLTGAPLGGLKWTSVMASKALHFLCRALGFDAQPPVPIDGGVIRGRVWPCFRQRIPAAQRPGDWDGDSFDAYRRYMTAVITWAAARHWTTTQMECTIFNEYG